MKERGMIFNGDMVRALLNGSKMQARRIMKMQPEPSITREGDHWFSCNKLRSMVHVSDFTPGNSKIPDAHEFLSTCCPFGEIGDRIWVRETYRVMGCATDVVRIQKDCRGQSAVVYQ